MTTVFIDGAAGTTGLEIRERLAGHAGLEVVQLEGDRRKDPKARAEALNGADVVILAGAPLAGRRCSARHARCRCRCGRGRGRP